MTNTLRSVRDIRDEERLENCKRGWHVRDTVDRICLECDDEKTNFAQIQEMKFNEPPVGSIVMVNGATGECWQRWYNDGLWHSTNGGVADWRMLVNNDRGRSRATLIYVPPARDAVSLQNR